MGASDRVLQNYRAFPMTLQSGSALVMDSRLLHCGGRNESEDLGGMRRRLLYTTWGKPGKCHDIPGTNCSIMPNLQGRLQLADFFKERPRKAHGRPTESPRK